MNFKQKVEAFKESCRMYTSEKIQLDSLADNDLLKEYLQDDIAFVEKTLDQLENLCGKKARDVIWELFVEERKQLDVAYELNMSRRKLQYTVDKWLSTVFKNDK